MANPNVSKIIDVVKERATKYLSPFSLRVDHRGVLGKDEADVLFFSKDIPWKVMDFREVLKDDTDIRSAYNSVPQHTEWTPHLTLGYPDSPAHPDEWDPAGTLYVSFDRIGIWYGDYEGTEITLVDNTPKVSELPTVDSVAWSDKVGDILAHHGVKGMKWGVRRDNGSAAVSVAQKGKKLKAVGGAGHKPSADAVRAKKIGQVKKKSGVHALTNEELQAYQKRLNLEQSVTNLERNQPGAKNFVKRLIKGTGNQQVNSVANQAASAGAKKAIKSAATLAAA